VHFLVIIASILTSKRTVQAMDRALVVDTLPTSEQAAGNAWAARMLGLGGVSGFFMSVALPSIQFAAHFGFFSGNLDLPRMFPFLGTQELQVLSFLASFFLIAVQCITCIFVKEKVLVSTMYVFFIFCIGRCFDDSYSNDEKRGFLKELKTLLHSALTLPRVIMQIVSRFLAHQQPQSSHGRI
jgi:solute carrier family 45 protein 1/2/4